MKRKTWVLAAAAVLVAVTATAGVVVMSSAKQATPAAQEPPANTLKVEKGKLSAMVSLDGTLTYRARSDGSPYSAINRTRGTYTKLSDDGDKVDCGVVMVYPPLLYVNICLALLVRAAARSLLAAPALPGEDSSFLSA